MVIRRFKKKGSVYHALESTSGLDFCPVVQLKSFHKQSNDTDYLRKRELFEELREKTDKLNIMSPVKDHIPIFESMSKKEFVTSPLPLNPSQTLEVRAETAISLLGGEEPESCLPRFHEKYPSCPVSQSEMTSRSHRSHSWTGQTDYPKEKFNYSRPRKAEQYKTASNQLHPVLEKSFDFTNVKKNVSVPLSTFERQQIQESYKKQFLSCNSSGNQFNFEGFHTPAIPQCFEDDFCIYSPPQNDMSSVSSCKPSSNAPSNEYCEQLKNQACYQAQYSAPLSWKKQVVNEARHGSAAHDTSLLDRLRMESSLGRPSSTIHAHEAVSPFQYEHQQEIDFDMSSENGTWMDSIESSSHGRGIAKWQGSFSDLSTFSAQLSNQSSLFDSGHSTMPESGRLSPQSPCNSAASSLLLEEPTRAQVIARHGSHHEIVAHSSRVQQPKRHGSESVLYYTTGTSKTSNCVNSNSICLDKVAVGTCTAQAPKNNSFSQVSVGISPIKSDSNNLENYRGEKYIRKHSRQHSRKNSDSYLSADLFSQTQRSMDNYASVSSLDANSRACMSNYTNSNKPKVFDKGSYVRDHVKPNLFNPLFPKDKLDCESSEVKYMEEKSQKFIFPEVLKKQRVSDPELKAIQKQAVMSFYQRMSLAESVKSDSKSFSSLGADAEIFLLAGPQPYIRTKMPLPKPSLPDKSIKIDRPHCSSICVSSKNKLAPEVGLFKTHSKSVPNLVMFKGQNLDLPASPPILNYTHGGSQNREYSCQYKAYLKEQGPLLVKEEMCWDHHQNVLGKKTKAHKMPAPSSSGKDPPEDNGGCPSGIQAMTPYKSVRKVQLKEVYHSNETASIKVMTADGLTLLHTNESKEVKSVATKRRPVPPPPKIQPPRRPPPPPPITPPPTQVMVVVDEIEDNKENSQTQINFKNSANTSSEQHVLLGNNTNKVDCAMIPSMTQSECSNNTEALISPKLPLPLLSAIEKSKTVVKCDEPMPLKDSTDVNFQSKMLDNSSLTYPEHSYSSYQSQQLEWQECCENNQTFHHTEVSMDWPVCDNFPDDKNVLNLSNQELLHYKIQPSTSDTFQSDCIKNEKHFQQENSPNFSTVPEELSTAIHHISNISSQNLAKNELCSIRMPGSEEQLSHQSAQIQQSSHERFNNECQTSPESHQKLLSVKSVPLPPCSAEDVITCESSDSHYLDNAVLLNTHVDLNQNPVKVKAVNPNLQIEGDLVNRINSASQTTDTDSLYCQQCKTKEEIEYEYLSKDFVHYYRDAALMNLLVPSPNHKTMINYVKSLLDIEFENPEHQSQHCVDSFLKHQNIQRIEKLSDDCSPLMCSSTANFVQLKNNQNVNDKELKEKKEKLMIIICKKVDNLKGEQRNIKAEIVRNELFGQEIANKLKDFAKPNELEKYALHIEEVEKIVNLLLSLSCRLAKAENIIKNLPVNCNTEEKKILETKRNKLREQHDDACRLKESIDRRSNHVSTFLLKYFSDQQYLDYDRFMKMKTKLIVNNREIDEKINLGEEQLAALSVVTHFWKSTNSCI